MKNAPVGPPAALAARPVLRSLRTALLLHLPSAAPCLGALALSKAGTPPPLPPSCPAQQRLQIGNAAGQPPPLLHAPRAAPARACSLPPRAAASLGLLSPRRSTNAAAAVPSPATAADRERRPAAARAAPATHRLLRGPAPCRRAPQPRLGTLAVLRLRMGSCAKGLGRQGYFGLFTWSGD
ncbi:hypothetical protein PVAP13_5NG557601 [Panicum virgatum]|uniref:Uncharacterized protein n=1 Tax=Panicum virgatum TaxID=38727 RepID=A0A8T0S4F0_PANVG|nr:hypothetical protein PVAP13_5NG557601 [Panicum virgatum]